MFSILGIFCSLCISLLLPIATTASYFENSGCVGQILFNSEGSILYNSTFRNLRFGNAGNERCIWVLAAGQATYNLEYHVESVYGQDSALTGTCISSTGGSNITLSNFQISNSGFSMRWSTEVGAAENYSPQSTHYVRNVTSDLQLLRKYYQNNELSTFLFVRDARDIFSKMIVTYSPRNGPSEDTDGLEGDCYDHLLVYGFKPTEGYVTYSDDQDYIQICGNGWTSDYYPRDEITLFVLRSDESVVHTGFNFVSHLLPNCVHWFE